MPCRVGSKTRLLPATAPASRAACWFTARWPVGPVVDQRADVLRGTQDRCLWSRGSQCADVWRRPDRCWESWGSQCADVASPVPLHAELRGPAHADIYFAGGSSRRQPCCSVDRLVAGDVTASSAVRPYGVLSLGGGRIEIGPHPSPQYRQTNTEGLTAEDAVTSPPQHRSRHRAPGPRLSRCRRAGPRNSACSGTGLCTHQRTGTPRLHRQRSGAAQTSARCDHGTPQAARRERAGSGTPGPRRQ
ncbi:hypothetical protein GDO81_015820 [Engystomops pustulosus]|uniref:Uncharacterized protein n=1 Tax=Engystomops pustulosus TaxID=76066 RepID=A0AAV7AU61_ENGPU|nr:hypothetical protein GDO81_015820 [Engystomops pustulosus]